MVDPRLEEVMVIVIGETSSQEFVPESNSPREETKWNFLLITLIFVIDDIIDITFQKSTHFSFSGVHYLGYIG